LRRAGLVRLGLLETAACGAALLRRGFGEALALAGVLALAGIVRALAGAVALAGVGADAMAGLGGRGFGGLRHRRGQENGGGGNRHGEAGKGLGLSVHGITSIADS